MILSSNHYEQLIRFQRELDLFGEVLPYYMTKSERANVDGYVSLLKQMKESVRPLGISDNSLTMALMGVLNQMLIDLSVNHKL